MCILFFYFNDDAEEDEYRIIVASNRDESWERPTKSAQFWSSDGKEILCALDQAKGKEGGTWLGVSKEGKLAVLLNVTCRLDRTKRGRGYLVTNFLKSDCDATEYIDNLLPVASLYRPFKMVALDFRKGNSTVTIFNSGTGSLTSMEKQGIISLDNATDDQKQWKKTEFGKARFKDIIEKYNTKRNKDFLINGLHNLLNDRTRHENDVNLLEQCTQIGHDEELIKGQSSVYLWVPSQTYCSRTHTIILVDRRGHCDYIESDLEIPVDKEHPVYLTRQHSFCAW